MEEHRNLDVLSRRKKNAFAPEIERRRRGQGLGHGLRKPCGLAYRPASESGRRKERSRRRAECIRRLIADAENDQLVRAPGRDGTGACRTRGARDRYTRDADALGCGTPRRRMGSKDQCC